MFRTENQVREEVNETLKRTIDALEERKKPSNGRSGLNSAPGTFENSISFSRALGFSDALGICSTLVSIFSYNVSRSVRTPDWKCWLTAQGKYSESEVMGFSLPRQLLDLWHMVYQKSIRSENQDSPIGAHVVNAWRADSIWTQSQSFRFSHSPQRPGEC